MAAHRYWRVLITATNGNAYTSLTEVQLRTSLGGSNVATGGTASASSEAFGWVASNAFNGSTAEPGWHSTNSFPTGPEWIKYDLGVGNDKDIVEFTLSSRNASDAATQTAKDFKLQFSDDDSGWTDAFSLTNETAWEGYETRPFPYVLKTRWRVYVTAVESGAVALSELEMRTSIGGANQCTGGTPIRSSRYLSSTFEADKAYDGSDSTFWSGAGGPVQWVGYVFTRAKDIVEYEITAPPGANAPNAPKTFKLQYVDGSGAWVDYDSQGPVANWSSNEARAYSLSAGVLVRPVVVICT